MVDKVIAAWPKIGEAVVCPVVNLIIEHLPHDIKEPTRCLLPESE